MAGPASPWKALSLVSIIGVNLAASTLLGVWLGNKMDKYFETSPWWMICGLLLGIGVGIGTIVPLIRKFLGDQANEE